MSASLLPKISIVMPVLNRANTIEKAILSVLDQGYQNLEFIIIDGGSTDHTLEIIKRYEKNLAYWHSQYDGSNAVASNIGIEKATGDLIALLMADDWYEPDTLIKIGHAYVTHPDADIITCAGRIVYFDDKTQTYRAKHVYDTERRMQLNFSNICFDITSAICCRFVKKSLYQKIGSFNPFDAKGKHMFSNDKDFLMRAVLQQAKHVFIPHMGHNYLASKDSSTFGHHKENILRLCQEHMELAERYLQQQNYPLSQKNLFLLIYWYNDQSTRLVLYYLLDQAFQKAWATAKEGIYKYTWRWPCFFCVTTAKIIMKKGWRKLRSLLR